MYVNSNYYIKKSKIIDIIYLLKRYVKKNLKKVYNFKNIVKQYKFM